MRILAISAALCLSIVSAQGQVKPATAQKKVFQTRWGGRADGTVQTDLLKSILDSSLAVRDERRKPYPVVGFRISYVFTTRYEDEESGEVVRKRALRVKDFEETDRLDGDWKASIGDNARNGDEILFTNVRIRLPDGKKAYAPDLRLKVE
jgi:hypothetical protein